MEDGEKNKWVARKQFQDFYRNFPPRKITSTDGDVFYYVGKFANNAFHIICLLGPPDEDKKFSCTISVKNKDGEKFTYTGKIHTLDEKREDIMASESCLKIGKDVVMRSLDGENYLDLEFSIRNLKEEAKDDNEESGISDNE